MMVVTEEMMMKGEEEMIIRLMGRRFGWKGRGGLWSFEGNMFTCYGGIVAVWKSRMG